METLNNISPSTRSIHWKKSDPASAVEIESFWKKLRHFYRTGQKADASQKSLSSALLNFLDDDASAYPYTLGEKAKETSIDLNENTPFYFLEFLLSELHQENRRAFKGQLASLIKGLNDLLQIDDKTFEKDTLKGNYDFANELIAFDKMIDMFPRASRTELSAARSSRLRSVIATLQGGLDLVNNQEGILVLEKGMQKKIEKESLFSKASIFEAKDNVFEYTQKLFKQKVQSFTSLIKAYRVAKLEIEGEYKEDIHNDYFKHFNWYRLLADELKLFQPIVVIVNQSYVFQHLSSFSGLMASNQPIKVVVLNQEHISIPNEQINWEDASHQFRQEIAALAMAHRNVYTFQTNMADPAAVYEGLNNCFKSTSPGICHLSVPKNDIASKLGHELIAKAANASRYFPDIVYDPAKYSKWGGKFDLNHNLKPEENWPKFTLKPDTSEGIDLKMEVAFTYADYKAIFAEKAQELMIVPSAYYSEHLIPLSDYLEMEETSLYGKIPYIWLIDEEKELHRAAVPNVWVVSCQERLDFWSFLQELSGLKSYNALVELGKQNLELNQALEDQKSQIEQDRQQIVETAQQEAIKIAAERLVSALLDDEELNLDTVPTADASSITAEEEEQSDTLKKPAKETAEQNSKEIDNAATEQAWVESESCTSCNDCIDRYPNLFRYNEDKQAYIDDPSKGSFEALVKAAENCPAACIHPGTPLNQSEENLDKLIKRAQKFNL